MSAVGSGQLEAAEKGARVLIKIVAREPERKDEALDLLSDLFAKLRGDA